MAILGILRCAQSVVAFAFIRRDVDAQYTPVQWIRDMSGLMPAGPRCPLARLSSWLAPNRTRWQNLRRRLTLDDFMSIPPDTSGRGEPPEADLLALLDRFADAWNRHDLDALMAMMTDDCVFAASAGPQVEGERSDGRVAVRTAFAGVFETFPDARWLNARHFIAGNRGVSEWTFTGTRTDGMRVEVNGCDLFTFRGGRIAIKNSFRKTRVREAT